MATAECDVRPWQPVPESNDTVTINSTVSVGTTGALNFGATYYCGVRACNRAGLCNATFSDGVTIVDRSDKPVVTAVLDGPGGADVNAQTVTWLMVAHWTNSSRTPVSHADLEVQHLRANGSWVTVNSSSVDDSTVGGIKNLTLKSDSTYRTCVRVLNDAGVRGGWNCSDGVQVGKVTD